MQQNEPEARAHIVYFPGAGYSLEEHPGPAPVPGSVVVVAGRPLVVTRVGRSPLPGDGRLCAYLEPGSLAAPPGLAPAVDYGATPSPIQADGSRNNGKRRFEGVASSSASIRRPA